MECCSKSKNHANLVAVLDIKSRAFKKLPHLHEARKVHSVVADDDEVCIKELPQLHEARRVPGVVADDNEVCIMGGQDNNTGSVSTNNVSDIKTTHGKEWIELAKMSSVTKHSTIASNNIARIYIFCWYTCSRHHTEICNKHTHNAGPFLQG